MLGINGRGLARILFTPFAKFLLKLKIKPDMVTVAGTIFIIVIALWLLPTGHLVLASILITIMSFCDSIDGTMARLSNSSSRFGAFLDSTCDRFADAGILLGLCGYCFNKGYILGCYATLFCIVFFFGVSYARARAEGLGFKGEGGLAERSDRLIALLILCVAVGFGLTIWILIIGLYILGVACVITVIQRIRMVYVQDRKNVSRTNFAQSNKQEKIKREGDYGKY